MLLSQSRNTIHAFVAAAAILISQHLSIASAHAGNEANYVLYSHHTEPGNELELNIFNQYSRGVKDQPPSQAQLFEIEYALTDRLTTALYVEGLKTDDESYKFGGWRAEARYRILEYGAFLNPVVYAEYENVKPDHRYILEVVGRTDRPEPAVTPKTEHAMETRLILGQDIGKGFDIAFNWINEANLDDGHWEFGYALGLNYTIYSTSAAQKSKTGTSGAASGGWDVKRVKIGAEMYGGLGDTTLGLTANPHVTQQYAGLNVYTGFQNGFQLTVGGAAGLTRESERALVRMMLGVEIK